VAGQFNHCVWRSKVSAGGFSAVVGYLKFVQRGYDLTSTLALLPIVCIVSACLLTLMLVCMRKRRQSCAVKATRRPVDISYVQVAPSGDVVSSLTHWPLRRQPSPLLTRQYRSVQFISVTEFQYTFRHGLGCVMRV